MEEILLGIFVLEPSLLFLDVVDSEGRVSLSVVVIATE